MVSWPGRLFLLPPHPRHPSPCCMNVQDPTCPDFPEDSLTPTPGSTRKSDPSRNVPQLPSSCTFPRLSSQGILFSLEGRRLTLSHSSLNICLSLPLYSAHVFMKTKAGRSLDSYFLLSASPEKWEEISQAFAKGAEGHGVRVCIHYPAWPSGSYLPPLTRHHLPLPSWQPKWSFHTPLYSLDSQTTGSLHMLFTLFRETLTFSSSSYPLQFKCPILRRLSGPVGPFVKYVMGQHIPPGSHCPTWYFICIYLLLPLGCKLHRHRDKMALIAFLPSTESGTE